MWAKALCLIGVLNARRVAPNKSLGFGSCAPRSIAAGGCYFFLDKKVTKKSSRQKCFFAHRPFTHKSQKPAGWNLFARLPFAEQTLYAKISYALAGAFGLQVFVISPEAYLPTGGKGVIQSSYRL
jgi:hypothetical protein